MYKLLQHDIREDNCSYCIYMVEGNLLMKNISMVDKEISGVRTKFYWKCTFYLHCFIKLKFSSGD